MPGSDQTDRVILATGGYDHTIRFWQAHSGICTRTVPHPDSQVNALEITPERHLIAAAGYQHIRMFDLNTGNSNPLISYDGIAKNVTAVGFQENGKWMYTGGEDNSAKIWDLRSRNLQCQSIFQTNAPVTCVFLHPNQVELFVGDQSGAIHIWDLKMNKCNVQLMPETDASVLSLNIDPDGSYMAAVNNKGSCYVWTLSSGWDNVLTQARPRTKFTAHDRQVLKCKFSPDSTLLATTSADTSARLWKTADFSLVTDLKERTQRWVWDCSFSADSQYIITASSDGTARLWSVETGEIKREYNGHQKSIVSLAFKDDAR